MPSETATKTATKTTTKTTGKKAPARKPAASQDLPPTADLQMEMLLKKMGFFYELEEAIALKEFDKEASLRNQARIGKPIDSKLVDDYVTAMKNGSVFPAVVAWERSGSQPLIIVDGNHRYAAYELLGRTETDTYIIRGADASKIQILTMAVNARHGRATEERERIVQGVSMVDRGMTIKEAAFLLSISQPKLTAAVKQGAADQRATKVGLDRVKWDGLPGAIKTRLHQIHTDEIFREMAQLTIDAKLGADDFAQAMSQLTLLRGHEEQKELLKTLRQVYASQIQPGGALDAPGHGRQGYSAQKVFRMFLGQGRQIPKPDMIIQHMNEHERTELANQIEIVITNLTSTLEAVRP